MAKIKLITDSGADIPKAYAERFDITVLPIGVVKNNEVFYDGYNLHSREYLMELKTLDEIPTTVQVPIAMVEEEFRKNLNEYEHQIYVTISSKSSGGYNTAMMLKSQLDEETGGKTNITVLDSMSFTMVYGKIVIKMAEMAQNGVEYSDIIAYFEREMPNSSAYFMVDDLNHLQKGGRIKPGIALIGTLLGIKPVLTINDGLVDLYRKERGRLKALDCLVTNSINAMRDSENAEIWIANGYADDDCKYVTEALKSRINPKSITECELGCVIGTHSGSGLVGIIFSK